MNTAPLYPLPKHRFVHLGRPVTLYKRAPGPQAPWYLTFSHAREIHKACLHTHEVTGHLGAVARAKQLMDAAHTGKLRAYLAALSGAPAIPACCTLAEMLKAYEYTRIPQGASDTTRHHNANGLRHILTTASVPLTAPASVLDDAFIRASLRALEGRLTGLDQLAARRAQRSAFSVLNHTASIVAPHVCLHLKDAGLKLPDFALFRAAIKAATRRAGKLADEYRPPSDPVLLATLAAWPLLPRNEFLAAGLALTCGLRAGEIAQARWSWFTERHSRPFLSAQAEVKNSTGRIEVQPIDPWFATFTTRAKAESWWAADDTHILTGPDTERCDAVFRRVSEWLRGAGWRTQKTNHALRALAGSMVLKSFDLYTASVFLRHSNVQVTKDHYAYFLRPESLTQPPLITVDWARAAGQPFFPKLVQAA